jgi:hypothetical protein
VLYLYGRSEIVFLTEEQSGENALSYVILQALQMYPVVSAYSVKIAEETIHQLATVSPHTAQLHHHTNSVTYH